jgi:hypothetical protein
MIEILPHMGKYKYDTWRILPVKCYIDNSVCLRSCIRNVNSVMWPEGKTLIESERGWLSYNTPSTFSINRSKDRKLCWIKSLIGHHLHHHITKSQTSHNPHHGTTNSSTNNRSRHKSAP